MGSAANRKLSKDALSPANMEGSTAKSTGQMIVGDLCFICFVMCVITCCIVCVILVPRLYLWCTLYTMFLRVVTRVTPTTGNSLFTRSGARDVPERPTVSL